MIYINMFSLFGCLSFDLFVKLNLVCGNSHIMTLAGEGLKNLPIFRKQKTQLNFYFSKTSNY